MSTRLNKVFKTALQAQKIRNTADKRLKSLGYADGLATSLHAEADLNSLVDASERTMDRLAMLQRSSMTGYVNKMERKHGKMREPVGVLNFYGSRGHVRGEWEAIKNQKLYELVESGEVIDADVSLANNLGIIHKVYEACLTRARQLPRGYVKRTYTHARSFALGVSNSNTKSGVMQAAMLPPNSSEAVIGSTLEKLRFGEAGQVVYLLNVAEYASSLEQYFMQIGEGGIMYDVFNRFKGTDPDTVDMRYTYVNPDILMPDLAEAAKLRTDRGRTVAREYRYILPAIAFGRPRVFAGSPNSKPGFKLGKGGRLSRKKK